MDTAFVAFVPTTRPADKDLSELIQVGVWITFANRTDVDGGPSLIKSVQRSYRMHSPTGTTRRIWPKMAAELQSVGRPAAAS